MKKYKVTFLPGFEEGLNNAVDYLSIKLRNPDAAEALVDRVEKAIKERSREPEAFEKYRSRKERKYPYYRIYVGEYIIFYVVIDDTMEVRRFYHRLQNWKVEL